MDFWYQAVLIALIKHNKSIALISIINPVLIIIYTWQFKEYMKKKSSINTVITLIKM